MALLFMDGFEGYQGSQNNMIVPSVYNPSSGMPGHWYSTNNTGNLITTTHATIQPNGYSASLWMGSGGTLFYLTIPATSNLFMGFNYQASSLGGAPLLYLSVATALTSGLKLVLNANGSLSLQTIAGGITFFTTTAGIITANTWYAIELNAVFGSGTSGYLELRVNGTSYIASGIDSTNGMAGTGYTFITFAGAAASASYIDDLYVFDNTDVTNNTFLGTPAVYTLFPASNGTVDNFIPTGAASNWQAVNQTSSVVTTKYNSTTTIGQQDLYSLNNVAATPTTVNAVVVTNVLQKIGNGPGVTNQCVVSGVTANGATSSPPATMTRRTDLFTTQPNGSTWTITAINNLQIGATT